MRRLRRMQKAAVDCFFAHKQICIQKQGLANDRSMPVFLGRTFLLIFLRKVNFKVVVCAVKESTAEVTLVMIFITMVEQFNIFFLGFSDKSTSIVNLVLGKGNTMIKAWKDGGCCF